MPFVEVGGAKCSERKPKYHKIPRIALLRLAHRFALGEQFDDPAECRKLNGRMNWENGDEEFWIERFNHAFEHLLKSCDESDPEDHLGAVMWYCAARMQYQESIKKGAGGDAPPLAPKRAA